MGICGVWTGLEFNMAWTGRRKGQDMPRAAEESRGLSAPTACGRSPEDISANVNGKRLHQIKVLAIIAAVARKPVNQTSDRHGASPAA